MSSTPPALDLVKVRGLSFYTRPGSSDIKAIKEVVEKRAYARKHFPLDGFQWIDLGANIGAFTVLLAAQGATVHAYEPDPDSFDLLKQNVTLNGLDHRVHLHQAAVVWDERTEVTLHVNGRKKNFWRNSILKPWQGGSTVQVPAVHVRDVLLPGADVKMDVEGAEMPLLEALETRPGRRLVLEWSFDVDASIPRFKAIVKKLQGWYSSVVYGRFDETRPTWPAEWFPPAKTIWCT